MVAENRELKCSAHKRTDEEPIEAWGKAYLDEFYAQIRKEMFYNQEEMEEKEHYLSREETEEYFNSIVGKVFVNELNGKKTYAVPYAIREDRLDDEEMNIYRIVVKIICFPKFYDIWCTVDAFQSLLRTTTGYADTGSMSDVLEVLQDIFLDTITALDDVCDDETFADELSELVQKERRKTEESEEELQILLRRRTLDALPFPIKKPRTMSPYKRRLLAEQE
ncbi:MAG: hypothetical protein LUD72_06395 [Bacteroidales bacterium]|nr:hypothetical protein [Bacteroidales bacterium]